MLTSTEIDDYSRQGYLLKEGILSPAECDGLCAHVSETIRRYSSDPAALEAERDEAYFNNSARDIGLFWEKGTDPASLPPEERERCVSRLGHGLHWVDPVFRRAAQHPKAAEALEGLNGPGINIVQTMIIYKQPRIGGELGFHQDASYLHTEPQSLIACWFALDDIDAENSPLLVIPDSHRLPLRTVAELGDDGRFIHRKPRQLEAVPQAGTPVAETPADPSQAVPVLAPRGSVIFFHGLLYHASGPNLSPRPRRAYAVHYASSASKWSPFNWIDGAGGFVPVREGTVAA
jgi:phytanoyl-CoA hydroxylase